MRWVDRWMLKALHEMDRFEQKKIIEMDDE